MPEQVGGHNLAVAHDGGGKLQRAQHEARQAAGDAFAAAFGSDLEVQQVEARLERLRRALGDAR